LPELPHIMNVTASLSGRLDSGAIDRVEAAVLSSRVGEEFDAVVLAQNHTKTRIQLAEPAVEASVESITGNPGDVVRVRLVSTTIATGALVFAPV
jgi:exoribonuclease R